MRGIYGIASSKAMKELAENLGRKRELHLALTLSSRSHRSLGLKLLVIWGKHDLSFDPGEPERYCKDVTNAEIHVLDAGPFALDYQSRRNCGVNPWMHEIADLVEQLAGSIIDCY